MPASVSHSERVRAVLAGNKPDRVPVALWRHFPVDDQDPQALADSHVAFQRAYDFDLVKVTPASSFCLKDWGAKDAWRGNSEGTREYGDRVIRQPGDWERLKSLDIRKGALGAQLACLRRIRRALGPEVPLVQTVFDPLAQAKNLAGGPALLEHLRRWPEAVESGLTRIGAVAARFVAASLEAGADGIFLAVQHASPRWLSWAEYSRWGLPHDISLMREASAGWLNIVHLHGSSIYFEVAALLPAQVVNWHDREAGPSLRDGRRLSGKTVCGGWRQWETIAHGDPAAVQREAADAVRQTGGRNLILGTGCVTPIIAPRVNLEAAARSGG